MPTINLDSYVIEYTGELLEESENWTPHVSISVPSANPMHMTIIFPKQRVADESIFATKEEAEAEAQRSGVAILETLRSQHHSPPAA